MKILHINTVCGLGSTGYRRRMREKGARVLHCLRSGRHGLSPEFQDRRQMGEPFTQSGLLASARHAGLRYLPRDEKADRMDARVGSRCRPSGQPARQLPEPAPSVRLFAAKPDSRRIDPSRLLGFYGQVLALHGCGMLQMENTVRGLSPVQKISADALFRPFGPSVPRQTELVHITRSSASCSRFAMAETGSRKSYS